MDSIANSVSHRPRHLQNWALQIQMIMAVTNHTVYFCSTLCRYMPFLGASPTLDPQSHIPSFPLFPFYIIHHFHITSLHPALLKLHRLLHLLLHLVVTRSGST